MEQLFPTDPPPRPWIVKAYEKYQTVTPPAVAATSAPSSLQGQFLQFHQENPGVYESLVDKARELRNRGHRVSIGMLYEVVRYEALAATDAASPFKLNNNYRSRYARLIMENEPDLVDAFDLRELRAA